VSIALGLLIIAVVTGSVLWNSYRSNRHALEERIAQLTQVLEEHTLRNIQAVDLLLQIIADSNAWQLEDHRPEYEDWLRSRLAGLPYVRAIYLVGADGFITQDTDHPNTPRVSLGDRAYFMVHQKNPDVGLHIGAPLQSRSVESLFLPLSRRLSRPDGSFAGIVAAALEPRFYQRFYAGLLLDPGDSLTLWYHDGTLIARVPDDHGLAGKQPPDLTLFPLGPGVPSAGTFIGNGLIGPGRDVMVGYRVLTGLPLVVSSSTPVTRHMTQWWYTAYAAAFGFLLLCILSVVTPVLIFRQVRERDEMHRRSLFLQKFESLGRMTGGIAHDFNNLLAAIEAGRTLIAKHADDPGRVREYARAVADTVEHGRKLTAQLLGFARGRQISPATASVNDLITELAPILRQAAGAGVRVEMKLAPDIEPCTIDRTQFGAAVVNLVINARDAMPDGGVVTIRTRMSRWSQEADSTLDPGDYALVRVSDTGTGIPDDVIDHVFEPFFTTKGDQGTGLGLAQVFGFMRQIGGDARIVRNRKRGTAVELYFPCNRTVEAPAEERLAG